MAFIKKRKVRGVIYYALVEKVRRPNGSYGLKQLKSFGRQLPREYLREETKPETNKKTKEVNRLAEQVPTSNKPAVVVVPKQSETKEVIPIENLPGKNIWEKTIRRLKEHYGD